MDEHEAPLLGKAAGREPEDWTRALLALGPRSVVVTLGAVGTLVADGGGTVPRRAREGGGGGHHRGARRFTAALAWRLGAGASLAEAAARAARVGAAAVTRKGAQVSFPTAEEVGALSRRPGY